MAMVTAGDRVRAVGLGDQHDGREVIAGLHVQAVDVYQARIDRHGWPGLIGPTSSDVDQPDVDVLAELERQPKRGHLHFGAEISRPPRYDLWRQLSKSHGAILSLVDFLVSLPRPSLARAAVASS